MLIWISLMSMTSLPSSTLLFGTTCEMRIFFRTLTQLLFDLDSILSHLAINRKDAKKVSKLEAQIPYHEGRGNKEEVEKIRQQVEDIWAKAREQAYAM
mmetsp:Transcript_31172/g.41601  ORF Transcript_31172/g.41601 Transcript_31172/m.41601 type:complete len:98 (+) Transcript_31172:281-574(+)